MLKVKNVRKAFKDHQVLRNVELEVDKGDVVVILGPSGSGKTTFLRCLEFLEHADGGEMIFDDIETSLSHASTKTIEKIRKKTAFVFQNYNLFANKTALQNVTEGLIIGRKIPKQQAEETAKKALDKVGLSDKYDFYPSQLSGGQQQRIAIARAVVTHPDIVLADEPTGNLDYNTSLEIMELFMQLKKEEKQSFIVVTHDPIIATYADRVIFLHDGEIKNEYKNEEGSDNFSNILAMFRGLVA